MFLKTSCTEQHTGCGHHSYSNLANVQLFVYYTLGDTQPSQSNYSRIHTHRFRSWKGGMAHSKIISRMPQSWETHLDNNAHRRQSEITHHIKACVIHARGSQQSSAEQTQWYWSCHNSLCNQCGGWGIIINLSPSSTGYTELIVTCILNSKILNIHLPRIPYIYVRNFLKLTWAGKLTSILQNGVHELIQSTYTVSYDYQDSTSHGPLTLLL